MNKLIVTGLLVLIVGLVGGCGAIPRTASECRIECKKHLHFESPYRFEDLHENIASFLNKEFGHDFLGNSTGWCVVKHLDKGIGEITVVSMFSRIDFVVDLQKLEDNKTSVDIYTEWYMDEGERATKLQQKCLNGF